MSTFFQLDVLKSDQRCVFCLAWPTGERRFATVPYPDAVLQAYAEWQSLYLRYYRNKRGRKEAGGQGIVIAPDLGSQLEEKRATLLHRLNEWLRDGALTEIREAIAQAMQTPAKSTQSANATLDLFLACEPIELARLPWEAWTLVAPSVAQAEAKSPPIRLLRTRLNQAMPTLPKAKKRQKLRILVIVGKDEVGGLDFERDFAAMQRQLAAAAVLERVGWEAGKSVPQVKQEIARAIADPVGWDALFFAGHSNETALTGGELGIAPQAALQIAEIQPELEIAVQRGLQFAFFNSCSGLAIADALIDLGLNQVAIMREPIANTVAQVLLVEFLQQLANHRDVQDALQSACQFLKTSTEGRFKYPSAYLVPSLYGQPHTPLFHIPRQGWKHWAKLWRPTLPEAIALAAVSFLCLLYPVQNFLLEQRLLVQSVYRNGTGQIQTTAKQPVLLVAIDQESIDQAGLSTNNISPMSRSYLATLVDKATTFQPSVIGLDYFLKGPTNVNDDAALNQSIRKAVQQHQQWITFAARKAVGKGEITATAKIFDLNWALQAHIRLYRWKAELLPADGDCTQACPLGYLLALSHALKTADVKTLTAPLPEATLSNQSDFRSQVMHYLQQFPTRDRRLQFIQRARLPPITEYSRLLNKSHEYIDQRWFQPIIDFSVPPNQVYERIAAKDFLLSDFNPKQNSEVHQQIILIAPGGYEEAGIKNRGADNFPVPAAVHYWRGQQRLDLTAPENLVFTGGEFHAYMIQHLLAQRLVVPIPDLWMILLAALVAKAINLKLSSKSIQQQRYLLKLSGFSSIVYGVISIQFYLLYPVLFPWVLPSIVFWFYLAPALRRQFHA
jgi:CHASE2 domain/CHAT domain